MVNLVNMPVSRERMEKYQNKHLRQVEHAAKQLEGREMKVKNNNLRKETTETNTIDSEMNGVTERSLGKPCTKSSLGKEN